MSPTEEPTTEPSDETFQTSSSEHLSTRNLHLLHLDVSNLTYVPPSSTSAPYENITQFESLNLRRIFGCRRFRNQKQLTEATNTSLLNFDIFPSTIASFATIPNPPKGKVLKKHWNYLDKVHMDIVFDDCLALGEHCYALLLVDVSTRYC